MSWLLAPFILVGLPCALAHAGEEDRLFRDGFDPCCSLGGEVSGLIGNGLVLHLLAGAVSEDKPIAANGGLPQLYTFSVSAATGTSYAVSVTGQPDGQFCSLSNASGTLESTPIENINASCADLGGLIWDQGDWDEANWQ